MLNGIHQEETTEFRWAHRAERRDGETGAGGKGERKQAKGTTVAEISGQTGIGGGEQSGGSVAAGEGSDWFQSHCG